MGCILEPLRGCVGRRGGSSAPGVGNCRGLIGLRLRVVRFGVIWFGGRSVRCWFCCGRGSLQLRERIVHSLLEIAEVIVDESAKSGLDLHLAGVVSLAVE